MHQPLKFLLLLLLLLLIHMCHEIPYPLILLHLLLLLLHMCHELPHPLILLHLIHMHHQCHSQQIHLLLLAWASIDPLSIVAEALMPLALVVDLASSDTSHIYLLMYIWHKMCIWHVYCFWWYVYLTCLLIMMRYIFNMYILYVYHSSILCFFISCWCCCCSIIKCFMSMLMINIINDLSIFT